MVITTKEILDELTAKAKENPRLRCNLDMRNSADDQSQRMLNALEPGRIIESTELWSDGNVRMLNVEKGHWHSLECLESGSVLFEAKDGAYQPLSSDDIMEV